VACEGLDPLAPDGAPAPGRPQGMACKWRPPGPKANSPNQDDYPEKDREFNRYTLLREYDLMFLPLLKEQCHQVGNNPDRLAKYLRAHLNRGLVLLQKRVKSVGDTALFVAHSDVKPADG